MVRGSVVVKSKIVVSLVVWSPTVGVVCCSEVVKSMIVVPSVVRSTIVYVVVRLPVVVNSGF